MIYQEKRCSHYYQPVRLDELFVVHCSALNNDRDKAGKSQPKPDFGLYADYKWAPTWRNEFINWPDFSVPADPFTACAQISDAYALAKMASVEIGCIGGHGRTGTMLACMFVHHLKVPAQEAIAIVRDVYCPSAVETADQAKFVSFYEMMVVKNGESWNPEQLFMER